MKLKVKSQLDTDAEAKKGILDDCGPSSMACAVGWATAYAVDPSAADGVAAKAKATGRVEKQGVSDNGSDLADLIKTAEVMAKGIDARWAKDWNDVVASAKAGAAIGVWVQAPKGYPKQALSKWHHKWEFWWGPKGGGGKKDPGHRAKGYGHMTCAAWDATEGWQFADPTMSGKGAEEYGAKILESDLKAIASGKPGEPHKKCIIITYKKPAEVVPAPVAPVTAAPTVGTTAPKVVASTPAPVKQGVSKNV